MQVKTTDAVSSVTSSKTPYQYKSWDTSTNLTSRGYPSSQSPSSQVNPLANSNSTKTTSTKSGSPSASDNSAYLNSLLASLNARADDSYYQQMRAAAQAAYDNGMNALNSAYDAQMNSLNSNLSSTKNQLLNSYNNSKKNINDDAASSLRQAYINKMLSQKNLAQQMSAQGLSGGATETTLASMQNNYGNARNNINTTTNKNLTNLEQNYNDNLAQAMQAYNSAVAQANLAKAQQAIQLESALANNQISALGSYQDYMRGINSDYVDLLKAAIQKGANFSFDPTTATNLAKAVGLTQAAPTTNGTNYALLQAMQSGGNAQANNNALSSANTNSNANLLASLLSQLG